MADKFLDDKAKRRAGFIEHSKGIIKNLNPDDVKILNFHDAERGSGPVWTEYALKKAAERFPGVDLNSQYVIARLLPKKGRLRSKIKSRLSRFDRKWMEHGYIGRYCKVTPDRIVFVLAVPEIIITVFQI